MRLCSAIKKIAVMATHPHVIKWIKRFGVIGLFIFAFGIFFRHKTANAGILIMVVAFVLLFNPIGKRLIKDPLLILGSIFFLFVATLAVRAIIEFDGYQTMIVERIFLYGCVFLLVFLVAFWMHQVRGKWDWIFFTFLTGFLAQIIRKSEWANFMEVALLYWTGVKRAGFGSSVNRFGLWSAIILLACALLHKRLWGCSENKFWYGIRITFWFFMCSVSAMGLVFSQSRAAWLASAIVTIPIVLYKLYKTKQLKFKAISLLAIILICVTLLTNLSEIVGRRVLMESNIDMQKGSVTGIASIDERLQIYKLFFEKWKDRPLIGYGPGTSRILLKRADGQYEKISRYDHFHNILFDLTIQLGIVGLILYGGCFFVIIRQLVRGKQRGQLELDYYLVALGGLALIGIAAQSAQPLNDTKGLYAVGLLGGIAYAWTFNRYKYPVNESPATEEIT
jgi:O-antigen ligase